MPPPSRTDATAQPPRLRARDRLTLGELKIRWARFRHSPRDPRISTAVRIAVVCIVLAEAAAVGYVIGVPEEGASVPDPAGFARGASGGVTALALGDTAANAERNAMDAGARAGRRAGTRTGAKAGARAGAASAAKEKKARAKAKASLAAAAAAEAAAAAKAAASETTTDDLPPTPVKTVPPPVTTPAPAPPPEPAPTKPCFDARGFPC